MPPGFFDVLSKVLERGVEFFEHIDLQWIAFRVRSIREADGEFQPR
jgi:hypothetical protein